MSDFMQDPVIMLQTKEDLMDALTNHQDWKDNHENLFCWRIKSQFLIECIREIEETGYYPYNEDVWLLARKKIGLEKISYDNNRNDLLDVLVYNAQSYKTSDDLLNSGYQRLTKDMIIKASQQKMKILSVGGKIYNPRQINNEWYAMKLHTKNYCLPLGSAAKLCNPE